MRKQDKENWEFGNKLCVGDTEYDGQWVLIKDSKVIAHGNDPEIFTKCQDEYPNDTMLLMKIPTEDDLKPRVLHNN